MIARLSALVIVMALAGTTARAAPDAGTMAPPGILEAEKLSKVPKQKKAVRATYPAEAAAKGIETDVTLLLDIDARGVVTRVAVQEPLAAAAAGYGFEEAASAAANQFDFEPAEIDGTPIAVQILYVYRFRLPTPAAPGMASAAAAAAPPVPGGAAVPGGVPARDVRQAPVARRSSVVNFIGRLLERGTRTPMVGLVVTIFKPPTPARSPSPPPPVPSPAARGDGAAPGASAAPAAPALQGSFATEPEGYEATVDDRGNFNFVDLAPGEWRVIVEAPGYYPFRTTELIRSGEAIQATYLLERGTYNPFDVTVTSERPRKEVNRIILPAAVIDKIPGTAGDPLTVLQNLPGVARTPLFGGEVVVRGAAPEDTQLLVEGATVPNVYHFGGLRSVLPIGMLDSIEFQPGNFDSFYGRAIGGIVDVKIKRLEPKRIGGYIDINLLDSSLYLEAPISPRAAVAIAGRRSYIDLLVNGAGPDETGINLIHAPRYYDYQLVANYRPANAHDLRLLVFGSDDLLVEILGKPGALAAQVTSNRFNQHVGFYRALMQYRYVPGPLLQHNMSVSVGNDMSDVSLGRVVFNVKTTTLQFRDTARFKLTPWLTVVGGLDVLFQRWAGIARLPQIFKEGMPVGNQDLGQLIETRLNDVRTYAPAGFAELELNPVEDLFLSVGARADYFSRISEETLAPRLVARYQVVPSVTLKGGVGLYYQEPQFDETDPNFGNPALRAERAVHLSAGVEWKPRLGITLDGTLFYKNLSNLVRPTGESLTENGVTRALRYDNAGVGRVAGLELLAKHDFTDKFAGWIAYTLSRSERRDAGAPGYRVFDLDQTHILAVVATYQLPRNWQIGARFRFVSGTPNTPVIGSIYNNVTDQYDPTYGTTNSSRDPPFHQLDIRVDEKWIFDSWTATGYLDLQNVYNRVNPEGQSYNYDYTRSSITQGLPVLAIVGFKAEF